MVKLPGGYSRNSTSLLSDRCCHPRLARSAQRLVSAAMWRSPPNRSWPWSARSMSSPRCRSRRSSRPPKYRRARRYWRRPYKRVPPLRCSACRMVRENNNNRWRQSRLSRGRRRSPARRTAGKRRSAAIVISDTGDRLRRPARDRILPEEIRIETSARAPHRRTEPAWQRALQLRGRQTRGGLSIVVETDARCLSAGLGVKITIGDGTAVIEANQAADRDAGTVTAPVA